MLGRRAEYRTDKDLYHVIRLQKMIENIESLAREQDSEADVEAAYMRVRTQLEQSRAFLSVDVSDSRQSNFTYFCALLMISDLLFMQFHTAKLFLFQVAFFERNLQQSPAMHLKILSEGLEGAKSFLDLYLWLPPKSEMALTNPEWIQLSFGVTQAAKFAIVSQMPAVEAQTRELRQRLNIDHVFRHLSLRIGALVGRAGEGNKKEDIFYHYEQRTRKIRNWYDKMTQAVTAQQRVSAPVPEALPLHGQVSHAQSHDESSIPPAYSTSAQASKQQASQIPLSTTLLHQQPPQGIPTQSRPTSDDPSQPIVSNAYDVPTIDIGMAPLDSYATYDDALPMAVPDLMNAPGWDSLFSIPMEDMSWLVDPSQGYRGMNQASSPSENSWGDLGSF